MRRKEFKIGCWDVKVDQFDSLPAMKRELEQLPVFFSCNDYLHEGAVGGRWEGFKDAEELKLLMNRGITDAKRMTNIRAYASRDKTRSPSKFTMRTRYEEEGDDLDVEGFVRKDRKCWIEYYRERKPSDIVDITIVSSAPADIRASSFDKAAAIVASCITALEKKGYKTRITALRGMCDGDIYAFMVPIKTERERINFPRLMFISSTAFVRGVGFTWVTRTHHTYSWGHLGGFDNEFYTELVHNATGRDEVNIVDLVRIAQAIENHRSDEEVIAIAQDMIHYRE